MHTNVNLAAPIGALAFLGTAIILFVTALILGQSLIVRKTRRARVILIAMVIVVGAYFGVLFIFSIISHDKLLARGEEKHFCELDCHLAYSIVTSVKQTTFGE